MGEDFSSWSGVVKQSPLVIISSLSLIFCSAPVTGQNIYRWTDPQGRIHFTNAPVHKAEVVESEQPPTSKEAQSVEHTSVTGEEEKLLVPSTQTATDLSESDTPEENPKKDAPSNKKKAAPSDKDADDDDDDDEDDGSGASDGSDNPQDEDDEDEPEETEASVQLPHVFSFSFDGKIFIVS